MATRAKVTVYQLASGSWGWKMVVRKKTVAKHGTPFVTKRGAKMGAEAALKQASTADIVEDE